MTAVGDRYVLDELRRRGWALGGEQSGHIIDLGFGPGGDGIATALLTLEALAGPRSARARRDGEAAPAARQHPRGRPTRSLPRSTIQAPEMVQAIEAEHSALSGRGRVLVRVSGTEPLISVMVEAPTASETDTVCERLTEVVRRTLGHAHAG